MKKDIVPATTGAERNYGIDLLKIVAMMFICILHVCNFGGLSVSEKSFPDNYRLVAFFKALTYGALNMYAIISGYVGYNKKFKLSRPALIWLELVFYTILSTVLMSFINPSIMPENAWFKAVMPVMNREYWYMTAYFGMVVLMPLMNAALQKASMKTLSFVLLGVLVFYCVLPTYMDVSVFNLGNGYSTIWLCVMYIVGGYIARIRKKPHPLITFAVFVIMVLLTWFAKLNDMPGTLSYTSPTVMLSAVAMVMTFCQIKIKHRIPQKIISFTVPSTLGIFIIHVHTFAWETYVKDCAKAFAKSNVFLLALMVLVIAAAIFFICFGVDVVRRGLFRLLHLKQLMHRVDSLLERLFGDKKSEAAAVLQTAADGADAEQKEMPDEKEAPPENKE